MSIPLFYPPVTYVKHLELQAPLTLRELCERCGAPCRASGGWTNRLVDIVKGASLRIIAEPGSWSPVRIEIPAGDELARRRIALGAMAYGIHDLVAKQSIAGQDWCVLSAPRGRPRKRRSLTNRERQRNFRERQKQRGSQLQAE